MKQEGCKFKTTVGGQALMEGIMMRGPAQMCSAVRRADGSIQTKLSEVKHYPWEKLPLVRGAFAMVNNLIVGYRCLLWSSDLAIADAEAAEAAEKGLPRPPEKETAVSPLMLVAAVLGGMAGIFLFMVLPTTLVGLLNRYVVPLGRWPRVIAEAVLKIAIFLVYMWGISFMKDIKRLYQYHGAEHKTIACYEAGQELTVENARRYSRFHPRCGTSFLILVVLVSIFLYSVLPWSSTALRVVYKIALLPVVMGISYELLKWCGRSDNVFTRVIRAPGLWVQRLTVFEPEDSMLEVAIAAVKPVLPANPEDGKW